MAYRGGDNPHLVGIAMADSWRGPYVQISDQPVFATPNEDPGLFVDQRGNLHMLTHYMQGREPGGHAFSPVSVQRG
jgi:hypothetical protein